MHRDLTPNNIMLGEHDKVTISKVLIGSQTFHIFILLLRNAVKLHLYVRVIVEVKLHLYVRVIVEVIMKVKAYVF